MKAKSPPKKPFYSLNQVGKQLGLCHMTIYRYVVSKKLPAYKFGHHYRVKQEDLDAFVSSRKV